MLKQKIYTIYFFKYTLKYTQEFFMPRVKCLKINQKYLHKVWVDLLVTYNKVKFTDISQFFYKVFNIYHVKYLVWHSKHLKVNYQTF